MENSSRNTLGIVLVVVIIVAGVWLMMRTPNGIPVPAEKETPTSQNTSSNGNPGDSIQSSGTSNTALDQDSASIDVQMQGLSSDNAQASQTVQ